MARTPRVPKTLRKELTSEQRSEIIGARRLGQKPPQISKVLGHPLRTVYNTLRLASTREENKSQPRGRSRKTTTDDDSLLAEAALIAPTRYF